MSSDRPILIFITDTDTYYLYVYEPDNRYSERYLFTVIKHINNRLKSILHFGFSSFQSS